MKTRVLPWLLAARPKTLPAAIVPVWVGSYPAMAQNSFSWLLFASTMLSCVFIQIATNLFNDAIDSDKGADTEHRLGPKRVTATNLLPSRTVMIGALIICGLAAVAAIPMIEARGWPIIVVGAVSLFFAYGYTGGPVPLAYRGLGELFVLLFFGFTAVIGSWYVQTGLPPGKLQWITGLQFGLLSCVLIAINNLRDIDEDASTNKRTLAVRFGKRFARCEIALFCTLPLILMVRTLGIETSLWSSLLGIFAIGLSTAVFLKEPSPFYNKLLAISALQLILHAVAFSMSL